MKFIFILLISLSCRFEQASASSTRQIDIAYDRAAQRLELVRNQIELSIANHRSLAQDVERQGRDFAGMDVYRRIPLKSQDFKDAKPLLESLRKEFEHASVQTTNSSQFSLRGIKFLAGWKTTQAQVPKRIPFDQSPGISEKQIVDQRPLQFEVEFKGKMPVNPMGWLRDQQNHIARLLVLTKSKVIGTRLIGTGNIYRYRELDYPELVAPDLSKYGLPKSASQEPASPAQLAAEKRIRKYRQEIIQLWPKAQPHLDDFRKLALNDLRMSFFLKHANKD